MIFCYPAGQAGYEGHQHRHLQHAENGQFPTSWEEDDVFRRHAFFDGFIHHRTRNRGDVIDVMQSATFERRCQLCHFAAFAFSGKAQPQHGVHFVILNMQHGTHQRVSPAGAFPARKTALAPRQ